MGRVAMRQIGVEEKGGFLERARIEKKKRNKTAKKVSLH